MGTWKKDAILCYDQALRIEPSSELAWENKGNALNAKGDYKEALLCFKEALKIANTSIKKSASTSAAKGEVKVNNYIHGIIEETQQDLAKVISIKLKESGNDAKDPRIVEVFPQVIRDELEPLINALERLSTLLSPRGFDITDTVDRAHLLTVRGKFKEALLLYTIVLDKDPSNLRALNSKGVVLERLGKRLEALKYLDLAIEFDPKPIIPLVNRGIVFQKLGKKEEAEPGLSKKIGKKISIVRQIAIQKLNEDKVNILKLHHIPHIHHII